VLTKSKKESENGVKFYNSDIETLISNLKKEKRKDIYCISGGQIIKGLMDKNLIDDYIISLIPIILEEGIRLFSGETPTIPL
jgi:dihydrofolate reductase